MNNQIIKTCVIDSCKNCNIQTKTNCNFNIYQLLKFYVISLPSLIIGGIFIYSYQAIAFYIWLFIFGLFFLVIEIRVLCSHCPHYKKSSFFLSCWANYGAPKLWRYRPGPMNFLEKSVLITGFIIIWGYPLIYLFLLKNWLVLTLYVSLVTLFFFTLRTNNCVRCTNLSCPLNNMDPMTKRQFLKNNPEIQKHWENT